MRSFLLATTALLAGCAVSPNYRPSPVALTPAYHAGTIAPADGRAWWTHFNDPVLDRLVGEALAQNLDIAAASSRVDQARAVARAAGAALLPSVDMTGSAERDRTSSRTPNGAVVNAIGLPHDYPLYQLGARASWEIDLFGGLRRGREAARADAAAEAADAGAVRLSVAAETADSYLQLRGLQARLAVSTQQLVDERRLADLIRQRVDQGLTADRELNRVSGEVAGLEAALAPLRAGIAGQINRLAVLTGRQAGLDPNELATPATIPLAPDPAGDADPGALMRRRPDLVAAERRVAAANARIGVAIADYYPHLSLGGLLGTASFGVGSLFGVGTVQASGMAGLRWRLFDFGRVDAEVARARGRDAELLAQYRGAALRATEDVETALTQLAEGRAEIAAREREVAALIRARDQARQAYAGGVVALVEVIDADRTLLDASDRLSSARAGTARASVAAIRALGGGWDAAGSTTTRQETRT